jgi:hypothetical protein
VVLARSARGKGTENVRGAKRGAQDEAARGAGYRRLQQERNGRVYRRRTGSMLAASSKIVKRVRHRSELASTRRDEGG